MKRTFVFVISTVVLASIQGCASQLVTVQLDPAVAKALPSAQPLAMVKMVDTRRPGVAASSRETLGLPLGTVIFEPPEANILKGRLESDLTQILRQHGVTKPRAFECEVRELGVNTQSAPLYWDLVGTIRIVLSGSGHIHELTGIGSVRTFVWPGEEVIRNAFYGSLNDLGAKLQQIQDEL